MLARAYTPPVLIEKGGAFMVENNTTYGFGAQAKSTPKPMTETNKELTPVRPLAHEEQDFEENCTDFEHGEVFFENKGNVYLIIKNGTTSSAAITVETPATFDEDLELADRVINVAQDKIVVVGPFATRYYNDSDGNVVLTSPADVNLEVMGILR